MKKKISVLAIAAASALCVSLCACNAGDPYWGAPDSNFIYEMDQSVGDNYDYDPVKETPFKNVSSDPSSYFSLDRNTATYSLIRKQINDGSLIAANSVRIEEMINYFDYDFKAPAEKAVEVSSYLAPCPWNSENMLMLAGIKTAEYKVESEVNNYVFLIDVSGSMNSADRIGLAKHGLKELVKNLDDNDTVSIVTYANGINTALDGKKCTEANKTIISNKIGQLRAHGGTNGEGGLQRAYELATKHYSENGNNRVILISDGDFNVGMSSQSSLKEFIQNKAEKTGVYLSVLGVGMGNMRDSILETLATCGNGNYAYLDNELEAEKVLVHEMNGTLKTVAKDAKAGVTFTDCVEKYRLIGYDTKIISEDDFNNDKTDTGEIGSNLCVAALYEIKLADFEMPQVVGADAKLADIEIRYKDVRDGNAANDSSTCTVMLNGTPSSDDLSFISCVAEFGLILRNSKYKGTASIDNVMERLNSLSDYIRADVYRDEFVNLVGKYAKY